MAATTTPDGAFYVSREKLRQTLDYKESARNNVQMDAALRSATSQVEATLQRTFFPWTGTRYFDWPARISARTGRLWLDDSELVTLTTLSSGGTAITPGNIFLEPANDGPPFDRLEIDRSTSSSFDSGDTSQRSIAISGVWGYWAEVTQVATLAEALDASETGIDVSSVADIGVGDVIKVENESMVVTARNMATTSTTITGDLAALDNVVTVPVSSAAGYTVGEVILIDSERMYVVDIAANNLTVKRRWDGSVLAAHTSGATVYAPRTLEVRRGVLGTTAATHATSTAVYRHLIPGAVEALCIAEAASLLVNSAQAWAVQQNSERSAVVRPERSMLDDIRNRTRAVLGRKARTRTV
jgi:hypothetical protein